MGEWLTVWIAENHHRPSRPGKRHSFVHHNQTIDALFRRECGMRNRWSAFANSLFAQTGIRGSQLRFRVPVCKRRPETTSRIGLLGVALAVAPVAHGPYEQKTDSRRTINALPFCWRPSPARAIPGVAATVPKRYVVIRSWVCYRLTGWQLRCDSESGIGA